MTKQEIENWAKTAEFILTEYCETDSDGNNWAKDVFKKDNKYYAIEYINGQIVPHTILPKTEASCSVCVAIYEPKEIKPQQ